VVVVLLGASRRCVMQDERCLLLDYQVEVWLHECGKKKECGGDELCVVMAACRKRMG
jgi:hypothetical protein